MNEALRSLVILVRSYDGIGEKARLCRIVSDQLGLVKDRSIYYCSSFAVRFSAAHGKSFGNTVVSLSNLQKYDDRPFIVCLVTPSKNYLFLANTTFLKKISHSSHQLRENNIRGSFNGSDIMREFEGIENCEENLERLCQIHASVGFDGNLPRLVEATTNISPSGTKFNVDNQRSHVILKAPRRARAFVESEDSVTLKEELDSKVEVFRNEILLAALIENINVRWRVIEYLIAGEDDRLRRELVRALRGRRPLPAFRTDNRLGDYERDFQDFETEIDIKTKVMVLKANPKAYNLDKISSFYRGIGLHSCSTLWG